MSFAFLKLRLKKCIALADIIVMVYLLLATFSAVFGFFL